MSRDVESKQGSKLMDSGSVIFSEWLCWPENIY